MNLDLFQEIMRDDYGQKMTMYDNSRVFTPEKIAKQMVDMLPDQVWDPKTKFLDPCCKTGVFLIEIYNKLDEALQKLPEYSDKSKRRNHILNNQIFGIALDDESLVYSRRNVAGDIFYENIQYLPQFMRYIKNKDYAGIKKLLKQEEVFKMDKFDVVIGNPPYQENTGGGGRTNKQAMTLYDKFIQIGMTVGQYTCMITKDNWLTSEQLSELRKSMINAGLVEIVDYPEYFEIFQSVQVTVAIFLIQNGFKGETRYTEVIKGKRTNQYSMSLKRLDTIPRDISVPSILNKVRAKSKESFSSVVVGKMPFGIQTNGKLGATKDSKELDQQILSDDKYNIKVVYKKMDMYTYLEAFTKNRNLVNHYKICAGQQLRNDSIVLYNICAFGKMTITQQSYALLYQSADGNSAVHVYKYANTKFFRAMLRMNCDNICTLTASRFSLVPLQDFTLDSDIDWSKSVDEIDKQLYKKYNLTQEEIDYIEKTIKPMK